MSRLRRALWLALALSLAVALPAASQSGAGHDLTWNTIDGGGATAGGTSGYQLSGTIGQPDAGAWSGGAYTLAGGFWRVGAAMGGDYRTYMPLVLRR